MRLNRNLRPAQFEEELKRLAQEVETRQAQLTQVIQDVKTKTKELERLDTTKRAQLNRSYDQLEKERQTALTLVETELGAVKANLASSKAELVQLQAQHDLVREKIQLQTAAAGNLEQETLQAQVVYSNLEAETKVLAQELASLNQAKATLESEVERSKQTQTETQQTLDQELANFKQKVEVKKQVLNSEVELLKEQLSDLTAQIKQAKADDEARVKALETDELSLKIKIVAFNRERQEFQRDQRHYLDSLELG